MSELAEIAERINTGMDDPDVSRALIVFNQTDQPMGGVAVFRAAMSWPRDLPLPPVAVTDAGRVVASIVRDRSEAPDRKGRADRCLLAFSLCFVVSDIPANGWRTYIAAYTDAPSPALGESMETPGFVVVETMRHDGDLPPVGSLRDIGGVG